MNKKELKEKVEGLKTISNTLSGTAKDFADAVVAAFDEAAADDQEHEIDDLKKSIEEIAARFDKQDQEVAEKIAKVRESIMRQLGGEKKENKLTKELANSVAKAIINANNRDDVKRNVDAILKENGISGLTYGAIIDYSLELKVENLNPLYQQLHKTHFSKFFYAEVDITSAAQIAKAWDKTSDSPKAIQELTANVKEIVTAYIYKRQQVANEDLDDIEEVGQLAEFLNVVSNELRVMVTNLIVTAILVGDKVNTGKNKVTKFETIGNKTTSDAFTTVVKDTDTTLTDYLTSVGATTASSILLASARYTADRLYNPESKKSVMVMNKQTLSQLAGYKYAAGGDVSYRSKAEIAAQIGVDEIFTTDVMPIAGGSEDAPLFIALLPDGYWVKEKKTIDVAYPTYENNVQNLQFELNCGGKIHDLLSTAVFVSTAKTKGTTAE